MGIALLRDVGVPRWAMLAMFLAIAETSVAIALWFYSTSRPATVVNQTSALLMSLASA